MNQDLRAPINGLSHVRGLTDEPLSTLTVGQLLAATVRRWPERDAAVFSEQGQRFTWAELQSAVDTAAAGLQQLGVKAGDRVGIWSPNRSEWLITQFATARIGAILVNINPAYRLSELEYALNKAGVSVLVTAPALPRFRFMCSSNSFGAAARQSSLNVALVGWPRLRLQRIFFAFGAL